MGIEFAVHTYGHFEAMFYVLNGIKMLMNHDFADALIKLMALIATGYYALKGMVLASQGGVGQYFLKTTGMLLFISALLVPKADMLVVDRISGKKEIVTDLPYAFVLPVGALEAVGAGITSLFEQAFSPVSSMAYKDYGLIFGQRLVQESKNWRINNPEFARNMNIFIKRCVVLESMIGSRFTPEDIFASKDIFGLVTQNAGTFRTVDFLVKRKLQRVNCKEAGGILKQYLVPETSFLQKIYKATDFANAGGSSNQMQGSLIRNIAAGYGSTFGTQNSASHIIKQNMMINALKDYTNISDKYGYTRADDLQKSNWRISGELAKTYLPLLLNIMKGLIYASFIFIVPLMILSGGTTQYLKYCTVVFSLQIWPALNAVLNLFIELYSKTRCSNIVGDGLTFSNFNAAYEAVDTIVLVASGLQMSIPFLSFAIVQGGVSSFVHLANNIHGASTQAANAASNEITSGNRSFDNISRDTSSISNKSGYKTDWNQNHQEGAQQLQRADGSMVKTFGNGDTSIISGRGVNKSSGDRIITSEDGVMANINENINNNLTETASDEQHYNDSKNAAISNSTDLIANLAKRQSAGENLHLDTATEDGTTLQQTVNNTVALRDHEGYSWNQAATASVNAYIKAGVGSPIPGLTAEAGTSTETGVSASNSSDQAISKDSDVTTSNDTNHNLNNIIKAAANASYSGDNSIDRSLIENTKASYDQMQSFSESISRRKDEAANYNLAKQSLQNTGVADRSDITHDVETAVSKQYGVTREDAHQMVQQHDPRAERVIKSIMADKTAHLLQEIQDGKNNINNMSAQNAENFTNEHSGTVTNQNQIDLRNKAANEGLDRQEIQDHINATRDHLKDKQQIMTENANNQRTAIEHHNNVLNDGMNKKVKQYEKDRIGQGALGKKLGVGAPNAEQREKEYLDK